MNEKGYEIYSWGSPVDNGIEVLSNEWAGIEYYFDDKNNEWVIQKIESEKHGEGKNVVRKFAQRIGKDQKVKAIAIIEPDSRQRLDTLGVLDYVEKNQKPVEITTSGVFKSFKVTRLLSGGGLKIDKIIVTPSSPEIEDDPEVDLIHKRVSIEIDCHT